MKGAYATPAIDDRPTLGWVGIISSAITWIVFHAAIIALGLDTTGEPYHRLAWTLAPIASMAGALAWLRWDHRKEKERRQAAENAEGQREVYEAIKGLDGVWRTRAKYLYKRDRCGLWYVARSVHYPEESNGKE